MPAIAKRRKVYFPVYPKQAAFLDATALYKAFVGGRGCGKTRAGCYDLTKRAKSKRLYLIGAPTYTMLTDATMRTFLEIGDYLGVIRKVNQADHRITLGNQAEVIFRSADNPDRWRGPNLSGAYLDEASQMDRSAFEIVIACLREGGEAGWLSATFTPRGRQHWTYDVFGTGRPGTTLIHARTSDNPFLPEEFEHSVRSQYTSTLAAQELGGEFIDPDGGVFKREWFTKVIDTAPSQVQTRIRAWDLAATEGGCYSCGVKMSKSHDGIYYVENVVRGKWTAHERDSVIKSTAQLDGYQTKIVLEEEGGSGGKAQVAYLIRGLDGYAVYSERMTGDKVTRAMPFAAQCEPGNVVLVRGLWNADYVDELAAAPNGPYVDQMDASSLGFNKIALAALSGRPVAGLPRARSIMEFVAR